MQPTQHRIVFEQVAQRFRVGKIVHSHEFHVIPMQAGAHDIAADATETINAYFDCHFLSFMNWPPQAERNPKAHSAPGLRAHS